MRSAAVWKKCLQIKKGHGQLCPAAESVVWAALGPFMTLTSTVPREWWGGKPVCNGCERLGLGMQRGTARGVHGV